ncbi:cytochrome c oxidase, subunit II [Paenibacillus curdlanolyticus YK9]|uniref:Cytochrome c oxidase subunit 2 n=1 Tax=Paenibacillus curdlanolyticus YK9 TaxID=717606 RepID=E0I7U8_9BACL|nr:cytochrome c oxidase subunit II [Paenibacillus curdlanolyticus]EFM11253.1 cytochrome c oxidase, subunit II [Paenibacillus curdlanolyticus YK9]
MMKRWNVGKRLLPLFAGMVLLLSACGRADLSTLNPQGPVAQEQFNLMKLAIAIMIIVVIVVFAISLYVIVRFRRRPGDNKIPVQVEGNHKLEIIWTVIPLIMLVILGVPTVNSVFGLAKDYTKDKEAVQVEVTSHQFWWEFYYPEYDIHTAQELVIPTGKKISIKAKSGDVTHAFWIPSLAGKIDTNAGAADADGTANTNIMYFEAPKAGVYLGKCAELCGPSHALMDFKVKAVDSASFERWTTAQKAPVALPSDPAIKDSLVKNCLSCHAVGDQGGLSYPNLTDIGSRLTVAGILVNTDKAEYENEGTTEENLKRWIKDPEAVKPGAQMPKVDLSEQELDGIAKYLAGLKIDYEK